MTSDLDCIPFERLLAIRLVSHDADALADFYVAALAFERHAPLPIAAAEMALLGLDGTGSRTALTLAGQVLEIDQFDPPGQPYPLPRTSDDRCFQHFALNTHAMPEAWARVLAAGGKPVSRGGPIELPPENGSVTAVKFRDPEGHPLELLEFTPAQADAHQRAIDHSAIVVRDVAAACSFYAERGFAPGDLTLNRGPAQAILDGLDVSQVLVVPLNPPGGGAHLELLGYRDPAPRPENTWQLRDVAATRLVWQAAEAALLTDPDGHFHQCQPIGTPPASPTATG